MMIYSVQYDLENLERTQDDFILSPSMCDGGRMIMLYGPKPEKHVEHPGHF